MYVCICKAITDQQIRDAARSGVGSLWALQKELGVSSNCGKCRHTAVNILREEIAGCIDAEEPASSAAPV